MTEMTHGGRREEDGDTSLVPKEALVKQRRAPLSYLQAPLGLLGCFAFFLFLYEGILFVVF